MSWSIKVDKLGKTFQRGEVQHFTHNFREAMTRRFKAAIQCLHPFRKLGSHNTPSTLDGSTEFWALKDINMEIQEGEVVGVIGKNGAGKSTLLKIMSRITPPTTGSVRYRGRMASLLEVGTGFHGELTGRENIFLNGEILGMRHAEVSRKCDQIVAFAEVEKFVDTPVKFYSSGMYLRLAFAVAAHLEPEILVIDEVLAVGDASFQKKCLGKMGDVAKSGKTILFVSHNMGAVAQLCHRAILLHEGREFASGKVGDVLSSYSKLNGDQAKKSIVTVDETSSCSILEVYSSNGHGNPASEFDIDEEIEISIVYQVRKPLPFLQITATLERNLVDIVHSFDTDGLEELPTRMPGRYKATYRLPRMFLKSGVYSVLITAGTPDKLIQSLPTALSFEVQELSQNTQMRGYRGNRSGYVISPGKWETETLKS